MALFRSVFWFALFLAATFFFTVVFEHGFSNFQVNAEREFQNLQSLVMGKPKRPDDESDKLPPTHPPR